MPKVGISLSSSFEKLFHKALNPSKLHVFSCLYFPWLSLFFPQTWSQIQSMCLSRLLLHSECLSLFLLYPQEKLSCQVCGKCFPIYVSPASSLTLGNYSALPTSSPHLSSHRTASHRPDPILLTSLNIPSSSLSPYSIFRAHPHPLPVLSPTRIPSNANTIPAVVSFYWPVGSDNLPTLTLSFARPLTHSLSPTKPSFHTNLL